MKIGIWRQRIGYGVSDLACNLIWQMISLYLMFFYTDVMGLNALAISAMFVITRVIDGITDLLVGYCIDKTSTRWGKSRPYLLFGAIPFAVCAFLAFSVPDLSANGKLIYAYVTYFLLSLCYTIVNIPMASILPSLTSDTQERTALASSRMFFSFVGSTTVSSFALVLVTFFGKGNQALGFKRTMLLFGIISCIIFFISFFNTRETVQVVQEKVTLKKALKSLSTNTPWKLFALNIVFMFGAIFIQSGALVYYFTYYVGNASLGAVVATISSFVPLGTNFLVPYLSKKLGKTKLFLIGSGIHIGGMVVMFLAGTTTPIIISGAFISAFGLGLKQTIYFSMQADPVDYGEWKTGVNAAGTLSAVNGFVGKCAQAIAGGLSGALLAAGGYVANATQTPEALFAIKSLYLIIPILLTICSMITMKFYKLDNIYPQIKEELDARNTAAVATTNE